MVKLEAEKALKDKQGNEDKGKQSQNKSAVGVMGCGGELLDEGKWLKLKF